MKRILIAVALVLVLFTIAQAQVVTPDKFNFAKVRRDSVTAGKYSVDTTAWVTGAKYFGGYFVERCAKKAAARTTRTVVAQYMYILWKTGTASTDTTYKLATLSVAADTLQSVYTYALTPGYDKVRVLTTIYTDSTDIYKRFYMLK